MSLTLTQAIKQWMFDELANAKQNGATSFIIKKHDVECFRLTFRGNKIEAYGIGMLRDEILIEDDRVIFGKWADHAVVEAADPNFFGQFAYCLAWTGAIMTMGALPTPKNL